MKKIKFIQIMLASAVLLIFSQCYYDQILPEIPDTPVGDVSFQGDIIPVFDASCNSSGCHDNDGTAPDLTASNAYDALISGNYIDTADPENSELYKWMTDQRDLSMPLSGPNAEYNALVLAWIRQGAINN